MVPKSVLSEVLSACVAHMIPIHPLLFPLPVFDNFHLSLVHRQV